MIEIGDTVERISGGKADFPEGSTGEVVAVSDENVTIRKRNGSLSRGNAPYKLKVIEKGKPSHKKSMLKTVNNFMKKFLDPETQQLVKAGFINGDLEPTAEGYEALNSLLFIEYKDELVEIAKAKIAEEEAEKKK